MLQKSIGLVTFANNVNYGGALQEYALYSVLKSTTEGSVKAVFYDDPLIRANSQPVRYGFFVAARMVLQGQLGSGKTTNTDTSSPRKKSFPTYLVKEGINQFKVLLGDIIHLYHRKKLVQNFHSFFETYLDRTPKYSLDDFRKQRYEAFDILVSGSDQIWNARKFGLSEIYFLGFSHGESKKISYASSFGNFHFPKGEFTQKIGTYLSDYTSISVREASAIPHLKSQYGIDAFLALDPTLLLCKEEWLSRLNIASHADDKTGYLLAYALGNKKTVFRYAEKTARRLGLKLFILDNRPLCSSYSNAAFFPQAGPREFIDLCSKASFIVTNSFHATAFAINFNIPFYTIASLVPQRLESLLNLVGLKDRLLPFTPTDAMPFQASINFAKVNALLADERKKSLSFLLEALQADDKSNLYSNVSELEKHLCCGCGACVHNCKFQCISMKQDEEGFYYPSVDLNTCVSCRACVHNCPSLKGRKSSKNYTTYICKNKSLQQRKAASSGGVFLPLASELIKRNGYVAGAVMEDLHCMHKLEKTLDTCMKFCGSKYVQSSLGDLFPQIKNLLEASTPVLFSGSPCQVAGLKEYLNIEYPHLFCVDFLCHGVPSPGVFARYIEEQQRKYGGSLQNVAFRHKGKAWSRASSMQYTLTDGNIVFEQDDLFLLGFMSNLYLRPSCHACSFNKLRSGSDITIADYWGARTRHADFYDKHGISLVLLKTEKGKELFKSASSCFDYREADIGHAAKFQHNLFSSSKQNPRRADFFSAFAEGQPFSTLAQNYVRAYPAYNIKKYFGAEIPFFVYNFLKKDERC